MASQERSKKRRLPAWMKAVQLQVPGEQQKTTGYTSNSESIGSVVDSSVAKNFKVELEEEADAGKAKNKLSAPSLLSANDVIAGAMPFLSFPGSVIYSNTFSDCACFCEELLITLQKSDSKAKTPVGFDMEWPVSFSKGKSNKTALIQMCFSEERCYLFHISAIGKFPKLLGDLICDRQLILVGLNVETDLWKLERDFDLRVKPTIDRGSVVDVAKLANQKLKSSERWDLDGLCRNVLRQRLNKDMSIRCGSWTDIPLSKMQRDYAVADAYAGLRLYQALSSDRVLKSLK